IVVGPNYGNVGSILRATGNPVFNPKNIQSVADALYQAVSLLHTDLGEKNRAFARANWEMEHVGKMYLEVYQKLLNNSLPCL
ncbi:MAG: glycosyltransferase, partial [Thermoflavifilum sp.]|nr:glycosyltransferase [Thermoflavifilum sp.]